MAERPLWAPWRIDYITSPKDGECVFCAARGASEHSRLVVDRGSGCFSLLNAFPYSSGHLMVAPDRHVAALEDLDDAELLELMRLCRRATAALGELMSPDGFNVGLNLGADAGAGLAEHLHLHVVPRWRGDNNFMPVISDTRVIPQALQATRDALVERFARLRGE